MRRRYSLPALSLLILLAACKPLPVSSDEEPERRQDVYVPVSHYTFDAMNADDVSGHDYHGYCVEGATFTDDTPSGSGKALFINGYKNQYVNIPYNVFAGEVTYSISFWIKDFSKGPIISAISSDLPRCDFPRLYAGETKFCFYTRYDNYDNTDPFIYNLTSILSPDWHHVVVSCENDGQLIGSNALKCLYIDGKLVDKKRDYSQGYVNMHGWDEDIITSVQIGGNRNGYFSITPSMKIDNIRFYTSAIPPFVVKDLYEGRK